MEPSFPTLLLSLSTILVAFFFPCTHSLDAAAPSWNNSDADRQTLLCLKSGLASNLTTGALATWRHDSQSFCQWRGVTCRTVQSAAPRVVALDLMSLNLTGQIPPCIGNLSFLTRINMPDNTISGSIPPEIGRLAQLRQLNLSINSIGGVIPDALSMCSRLEIISLSSNLLEGEIPSALAQSSSLEQLVLSDNFLQGHIPPGLALLRNLSILSFARNKLSGTIPQFLGGNSRLTKLALDNNAFIGEIPRLLANSSSLAYLNLASNKLRGEIPPALFNSSLLYTLNLSYNGFSGSIPSFSHASSPLKYLSFTSNNLSGSIPSSLGNFSSLSFLLLALNNLQETIPESLGSLAGLQVLDMTYNNLSGTVPPTIYAIPSLTYLGLGANQLSGRIPTNIGYTLPRIQKLVMQGNQFDGPVPASLANASDLKYLGLRNNAFGGVIPSLGSLTNLVTLDLGDNLLEAGDWTFLSSLTSCTQLQMLYLDRNNLQGELPTSIGNLPENLQWLLLNDNQITGFVHPDIGNLSSLTIIHMERNFLSGNIPATLGNIQSLFVLNLAENNFSGEVPRSIGNLEKLSELYLEKNILSGSIPASLAGCRSLTRLNLSCNTFHGSIPPKLFSISSLSEGLDLSYNQLTGLIPSEVGSLNNLELFNLSNNQLSGKIPNSLGQCLHLESLRLDANYLEGSIPGSFMNLRGVVEMDLSQNSLSGEIPSFFESFSSLQLLNLSFNNFQGPVPTTGVFGNSSLVLIQGNKNLCTNSQMLQLQPCIKSTFKRKRSSYVLMVVVPIVTVVLVSLICAIAIVHRKREATKQPINQHSEGWKRFSYHDLYKATGGFSSINLVGEGGCGSVYRGTFLAEPRIAAVKVFRLDQDGASKSFIAECEALKNTRHRNLVRAISMCSTFDPSGNEFKALVLEHVSNGSLESWLHPVTENHGSKRPLNLGLRIRIATDIAAALDYLHNRCMPPLIHCDLKPSNVLLDDDMCARVGDFGLAKFLYDHPSKSLIGARGSIGYIAPEYGMGSKMSTEGDVYSYGIILLEMLIGKNPTDEMFKDGHGLHKFVELAFPHKIGDILEPNLIPQYQGKHTSKPSGHGTHVMVGMQECTMQLVKLGLKCSVDSPKDRPTMQEVYTEVMSIKETFLGLHERTNEISVIRLLE
ncbi:hypothetical protein VPH35_130114 [Triticum aestivum]|uniref:Receptor kinase-like protein Xa21 n=2 Tax=Triticum TaxID=4564 RepID=A0A9R1C1V2_TRITD|nr:probable LRR receptor-like serine/threonine-protein kinase At3g47570 [Triticum aestivum]VAI89148.1 unnamed protein product [Triticum turgidum subsp. durum]